MSFSFSSFVVTFYQKKEGETKTERNHDKVIKQLKLKAVVEHGEGSRVNEGFVFNCAVAWVLFEWKKGSLKKK